MSSIQNKLNNYEVVPPVNVWDKIAASLDESELTSEFPSKLYEMQVAPPVAAWKQIDAALSGEETPVVPMRKRSAGFLRYAAAAIVIGIMAVFVFKYSSRTSGSNAETKADLASTAKKSAPVVPSSPQTPAEENETPKEDNTIALSQPGTPTHVSSGKLIQHLTTRRDNLYTDAIEPVNPLYAYADYTLPDVADRYIMLMTPEGNFIRMSKKLGSLVCCVSGEEQDADCKSQIKKWQEKLAASSAASSPGNFLDILNMVNSLEDNGTEL